MDSSRDPSEAIMRYPSGEISFPSFVQVIEGEGWAGGASQGRATVDPSRTLWEEDDWTKCLRISEMNLLSYLFSVLQSSHRVTFWSSVH